MTYTNFVYILTDRENRYFSIGTTPHLARCVLEHKMGLVSGMARRLRLTKLVYYESWEDRETALHREVTLGVLSPCRRIAWITARNPGWLDLTPEVLMKRFPTQARPKRARVPGPAFRTGRSDRRSAHVGYACADSSSGTSRR